MRNLNIVTIWRHETRKRKRAPQTEWHHNNYKVSKWQLHFCLRLHKYKKENDRSREISIARKSHLFAIPIWVSCVITLSEFMSSHWGHFDAVKSIGALLYLWIFSWNFFNAKHFTLPTFCHRTSNKYRRTFSFGKSCICFGIVRYSTRRKCNEIWSIEQCINLRTAIRSWIRE